MSVYYFGVTRFSVYSPGSMAWVLSKSEEGEKNYLESLYSDERMVPRADIFFNKALPSYELMGKNYRYNHIVQYSQELPEKWKRKLIEIEEMYPFIILQNVSEIESAHVVIKEYLMSDSAEDSVVTMFRVDDDDVLSLDYLYQLSSYAVKENVGKAVSFGRGLAAIYSNGNFHNFRKFRQLLMSQGQAYIGSYEKKAKRVFFPKTGNHSKIDEITPVIVDSRSVAFLQTHHELQDTRFAEKESKAKEKIMKIFLEYECVSDYVSASKKFPLLKEEMLMQEVVSRDFFTCKEYGLKEALSFDVDLVSGWQYHVSYAIEGGSDEYNPRGALIGFFVKNYVSEIPGLVKLTNEEMGFYKYLPTGPGLNQGVFSFWVPEGVKLYNVFIKSWKCDKGRANIKNISLSV